MVGGITQWCDPFIHLSVCPMPIAQHTSIAIGQTLASNVVVVDYAIWLVQHTWSVGCVLSAFVQYSQYRTVWVGDITISSFSTKGANSIRSNIEPHFATIRAMFCRYYADSRAAAVLQWVPRTFRSLRCQLSTVFTRGLRTCRSRSQPISLRG